MKIFKIAALSIVVCLFAMMAAQGDLEQVKPGEDKDLTGSSGGTTTIPRPIICKVKITVKGQDGKAVGAALVVPGPNNLFSGYKTTNNSGLAEFTVNSYTLELLKKSSSFNPNIKFTTSGNALYGNGETSVNVKDLSKTDPIKTGTISVPKKDLTKTPKPGGGSNQPGGPGD